MTNETFCKTRRYKRISLPKGMFVAWYGGGDHQVSRVKTLGMGGLLLSEPNSPPVGTTLRLVFEVPGGKLQALGVVRDVSPGHWMGVQFTQMQPLDRALLEQLLRRLLH